MNYDKEQYKKSKYESLNKKNLDYTNIQLNKLHKQCRILEKKYSDEKILELFNKAINNHPEEWLILYELLEIANTYKNTKITNKIMISLNKFINNKSSESNVIKRALHLIK